jgi:prolyl 4-hydroxylase
MHHANVSTNYAWLPHNLDPSLPTPDEYKGMPVQPFGNKQNFYNNLMAGCTKRYKGLRCQDNEEERIEMSLRQPSVRSLV